MYDIQSSAHLGRIQNPKSGALGRIQNWLGGAILGVIGLVGVAAFLYPFFLPQLVQSEGELGAHSGDALFLFALLFILCLVVLFAEMESEGMNTKMVAVLGVLTAINAVLRVADTAFVLMNVGGVSPLFLLVILCGYTYGSRFGFLLGALSMVVSAIVTGGVGPWLPYQMWTMGWVGLTAGWLPQGWLRGRREERARPSINRETVALAAFGALWALLYGAILNLYFWPYTVGGAINWTPGLTLAETVQRYALFYVATSLWWDVIGAAANVALILLFGAAILKVLRRFQRRFH
ncbi:MAG: ECF transporter S component, partial [Ardenticatenaceae bacterium]